MKKGYILMVLIPLVCTGCVVPTGEFHGHGSRRKIDREELQFIQAGATNKEEILLKFGEPDMTWGEEKHFLYRMRTHQGVWLVGSAGGGGAGPIMTYYYFLLVEFDDRNLVKRHKFDTSTFLLVLPDEYTVRKKIQEWSSPE